MTPFLWYLPCAAMTAAAIIFGVLVLVGPGAAIAQDYGAGYLNDFAYGLLRGRLEAEGHYDAVERIERDRFLREQRRYQWQQLEYQRQYLEQLRRFNEEYQRRGR